MLKCGFFASSHVRPVIKCAQRYLKKSKVVAELIGASGELACVSDLACNMSDCNQM